MIRITRLFLVKSVRESPRIFNRYPATITHFSTLDDSKKSNSDLSSSNSSSDNTNSVSEPPTPTRKPRKERVLKDDIVNISELSEIEKQFQSRKQNPTQTGIDMSMERKLQPMTLSFDKNEENRGKKEDHSVGIRDGREDTSSDKPKEFSSKRKSKRYVKAEETFDGEKDEGEERISRNRESNRRMSSGLPDQDIQQRDDNQSNQRSSFRPSVSSNFKKPGRGNFEEEDASSFRSTASSNQRRQRGTDFDSEERFSSRNTSNQRKPWSNNRDDNRSTFRSSDSFSNQKNKWSNDGEGRPSFRSSDRSENRRASREPYKNPAEKDYFQDELEVKQRRRSFNDKLVAQPRFSKYEDDRGRQENFKEQPSSKRFNNSDERFASRSSENSFSKRLQQQSNDGEDSFSPRKSDWKKLAEEVELLDDDDEEEDNQSDRRSRPNTFQSKRDEGIRSVYGEPIELQEEGNEFIFGRHPIEIALNWMDPKVLQRAKLYVQDGTQDTNTDLMKLSKSREIVTEITSKYRMNEVLGNVGKVHQGLLLELPKLEYTTIKKSTVIGVPENVNENLIILCLDEVKDPMNLGAILRTANFFNVFAVLASERHSAPITPTVTKASSGATIVLHAQRRLLGTKNMVTSLQEHKQAGWRIVGTSASPNFQNTEQEVTNDKKCMSPVELPPHPRTILVMGSEETGIRNVVKQECDVFIHLPRPVSTVPFTQASHHQDPPNEENDIAQNKDDSRIALNVSAATASLLALLTQKKSQV